MLGGDTGKAGPGSEPFDLMACPDMLLQCYKAFPLINFPQPEIKVSGELIKGGVTAFKDWQALGGNLGRSKKWRWKHAVVFPYMVKKGEKAAGSEEFKLLGLLPLVALVVMVVLWFKSVDRTMRPVVATPYKAAATVVSPGATNDMFKTTPFKPALLR